MTYAPIGMLLFPTFALVSSVFLAFLIPFLDLGIRQSPMLRENPRPGPNGCRVAAASVSS
ncbi:MAG TPA: hypothetical protein VFJ97_09875 [Dermatophilaceae bacterium]|nr:hypothetical protein [Dermatophilaceae bacterium]